MLAKTGSPNVGRYDEDQPVHIRSTPFIVRVEKALNSHDSKVNDNYQTPLIFTEVYLHKF